MNFPAKLCTIEGSLVFMNNIYHKATVATVCTALSFTLGASEEVKAATFNLTPTIQFGVDASITRFNEYSSFRLSPHYDSVLYGPFRQTKRLAEFNISSFFLAPNTIISRAVFQDKISRLEGGIRPSLDISGYVAGLKQKLSPNKAQTGFISRKYVHIFLQPAHKSIRYSCSKSF